MIINKKSITIDKEGSIDNATGQRYQNILKSELEYGPVLGRGNGGMVRSGRHKPSDIPVAIKVSPIGV